MQCLTKVICKGCGTLGVGDLEQLWGNLSFWKDTPRANQH